jgi:hypothetical protein
VKTYELYKQEELAWKEVTELDKKQGVVIALSLLKMMNPGCEKKFLTSWTWRTTRRNRFEYHD